ncbi:UNVERIFIED_CONTAM: hypothetical protein Sangu_3229400 [Sesamum angustifolium]|uniref:Uncharacterized protein n=1 Tax=Sesamum angustifolium TaxID=2727405 RepID=A0AAW2JJW0_9LAMI
MAICFVVLTTDIERGFNITTKCPTDRKVNLWSWAAHNFGSYETKVWNFPSRGPRDWASRILWRLATKYCSRISSAGDVGRPCSFSGLVGQVVN